MTTKQSLKLNSELTVAHHEYKKRLNVYAFTKVHDPTLGEDLVQQAFIKTWVYLAKGGKIELMKAFLYRILKNLIVDEYRKHKTVSLDAIMEKGFEPKTRAPESSADFIDGRMAMLLIYNLPKKYKKIMQMRYIEHLSIKEIHEITGQSKNSIAVQAHRGLEKLRLLYNKKPKI